jgi:hypothetical protein
MASAKKSKTTKPKPSSKPVVTKANKAAPTAQRSFSCTGSESSKLTEYTMTGNVSSDVVLTNLVVTKNYIEQDGAAVSQPTVVMTAAKPTLTTPRESYETFVTYRLNQIPQQATAADVGTYTYDYRINFPDTIPTTPEFVGTILVQKYLAKEGALANDQHWDTTKLVIATSVCKFV